MQHDDKKSNQEIDNHQELDQKNKLVNVTIDLISGIPGVVFFHDEAEMPFARIPKAKGFVNLPIRSGEFGSYVKQQIFRDLRKTISKDHLEQVLEQFSAEALYEGDQHRLAVRVARKGDDFWYDLADGRAVRISKQGWEVTNDPPILFRRFRVLKPQAEPVMGGAIDEIFDHFNCGTDENCLLLKVAVITGFIPDIAHPVLPLFGPQGSGKSVLMRTLISLLDPANVTDVDMHDFREINQAVSHRWVVPFDNVSHITGRMSDFICKLATGGGHSKRKLWTDDDDHFSSYRRLVILNGVNLPVEKADALDRCILIELSRIDESKRLEESQLSNKFEEVIPRVLGHCFSTLSKAMAIHPSIQLKNKPRMADFAVWGAAISKALGYSVDDFLDAYRSNIERQISEAMDASPLGITLLNYLEENGFIEGTATYVLERLKFHASKLGINDKLLPMSPRSLSKRIQEISPNLDALGYAVSRSRTSHQRYISIRLKENGGNGSANAVIPFNWSDQ